MCRLLISPEDQVRNCSQINQHPRESQYSAEHLTYYFYMTVKKHFDEAGCEIVYVYAHYQGSNKPSSRWNLQKIKWFSRFVHYMKAVWRPEAMQRYKPSLIIQSSDLENTYWHPTLYVVVLNLWLGYAYIVAAGEEILTKMLTFHVHRSECFGRKSSSHICLQVPMSFDLHLNYMHN